MSDFKSLNLNPTIIETLESRNYHTPTPIQMQSIPNLLENKDLLGIAQTGTGKTAAFALPILNRLAQNRVKVKPYRTRVLVLTPTRELASQIAESFRTYGIGLGIRGAVVFGGVGMGPQVQTMSRGVDILVATPGRLMDLMKHGHVRFDQLEVFVLDEADRMLDMGFIRDVQKIIHKLPTPRQTLLFSATMSKEIGAIANSILIDPVRVEVTPEATTVERIEQKLYSVSKVNKTPLLQSVLQNPSLKMALVFSKTKHGADRVVKNLLKANMPCAAIHGNKSQAARERALSDFRSGKIKVLVATDIAARGIDIPGVTHVINFELPMDSESYVHRIGRTARAGREGVAISFCDETEGSLLKAVEKTIRMKVPLDENQPFHQPMSSGAFEAVAKRRPPARRARRY